MTLPKLVFYIAIKNKSSSNLDKVAAQQARRVIDRWVGFEVSPIVME